MNFPVLGCSWNKSSIGHYVETELPRVGFFHGISPGLDII